MHDTGCLGRGQPWGMVWGGRREEGSGWGTHIYLCRIHFDIWQNRYNIVKLKNKIKLNKKNWTFWGWHAGLQSGSQECKKVTENVSFSYWLEVSCTMQYSVRLSYKLVSKWRFSANKSYQKISLDIYCQCHSTHLTCIFNWVRLDEDKRELVVWWGRW